MNEEIILNVESYNPYVIGAVAYVEQLENGAKITIVDKNGTTTATVEDGKDGKSISSIVLNDNYTLTINYEDGSSTTTGSIRGATGASGVFYGEEEPIDPAINVWVDPADGDGSVLKIRDEDDQWATIESIVGEPAGFGTVTATVDANHGTPAVTVTTSGDDTAKNFAFAFSNLQPAPYDDSELQADFAVLQGQFDTAVAAVTTDTEVTDIRVGADGITDTTAGASVRRQFTDLKSDFEYLRANGILPIPMTIEEKGIDETTGADTNNSNYIRTAGYLLLNGTIKFIKRASSYAYIFTYNLDGTFVSRVYLNTAYLEYVFTADNTHKYRISYAHSPMETMTLLNADEFAVYQLNDEFARESEVASIKSINVNLHDGYYNVNGVIMPQESPKEKYTDKIKCYSGLKISTFLNYKSEAHALWNAVNEWKQDGSFVRTRIDNGETLKHFEYTYTPADDIDEVSFAFRGYNDFDFSCDLENDLYYVLATASKYADVDKIKATYIFDNHINKGINHRGYNEVAPENTIPAFKLSYENHFDFVETDVRFTSDGVPVLLHDATVDRTSNGTGNIADMTYAQARELDFGSWKSETYAGTLIPSFDEFIMFCRNVGIYPYIEISGGHYTDSQIETLINIVKKYHMQNAVTWISFYSDNLGKVVAQDMTARVGLISEYALTDEMISSALSLNTGLNDVFLSLKYSRIDSTAATSCENNELPLEAWTVDDAATMLALPSYVSGVTSDNLNFESVIKEFALSGN